MTFTQPNLQANYARTSGAVSVGTSSTVVATNNPKRVEITVVNDGANIVYLQLATSTAAPDATPVAPTAALNQGIRLNASGGSWSSTAYSGPIAGIAVTGATTVTVAEI